MAGHGFSSWWLVLQLRNNFSVKQKTYDCVVLTDFQHTKFSILSSLGFILIMFLRFCKSQPRYPYKMIFLQKTKEYIHLQVDVR